MGGPKNVILYSEHILVRTFPALVATIVFLLSTPEMLQEVWWIFMTPVTRTPRCPWAPCARDRARWRPEPGSPQEVAWAASRWPAAGGGPGAAAHSLKAWKSPSPDPHSEDSRSTRRLVYSTRLLLLSNCLVQATTSLYILRNRINWTSRPRTVTENRTH